MFADILFSLYMLLLVGYLHLTYSKKCEDLRFKIWYSRVASKAVLKGALAKE